MGIILKVQKTRMNYPRSSLDSLLCLQRSKKVEVDVEAFTQELSDSDESNESAGLNGGVEYVE